MYGLVCSLYFFFNDTATTEIYTLSLHDALPILASRGRKTRLRQFDLEPAFGHERGGQHEEDHEQQRDVDQDRKSTRLNSSHANISYAVFCLKKKKSSITTRSL